MKLTINNKLVIISKKNVLLFIIKFIWIIIVHFFLYILCFSYIYYILLLFIYMIKIGNWQSASNMLLSSFPLYQSS